MTINAHARLRTDRGEQGEHVHKLNPGMWNEEDAPEGNPIAPTVEGAQGTAEQALVEQPAEEPEAAVEEEPEAPAPEPEAPAPEPDPEPEPEVEEDESAPADAE